MQLKSKIAISNVATTVVSLLIIELSLNLLVFTFPKLDKLLKSPNLIARVIHDSNLGHIPNPEHPEHDINGYRNDELPSKTQIVTLGDSQTYGEGIRADLAWPKQLETRIGKKVYNMAVGSYGPIHSLALIDQALSLTPDTIIATIYAGNDFFDSFNSVYNQSQFVELKSTDPHLQAKISQAEQKERITEIANRTYYYKKPTLKTVSKALSIKVNSKIIALIHRAVYDIPYFLNSLLQNTEKKWQKAKLFAKQHPNQCQVFNSHQFKTIFTSDYRLVALNLEDPRIQEGLELTLRTMKKINELAQAKKITFIVVLIPTKEAVFSKLWNNPTANYKFLIENEKLAWIKIKDYFKYNNITYLDALPAMQNQLANGVQPYHVSQDGHPNVEGHKAISELVAKNLLSIIH